MAKPKKGVVPPQLRGHLFKKKGAGKAGAKAGTKIPPKGMHMKSKTMTTMSKGK